MTLRFSAVSLAVSLILFVLLAALAVFGADAGWLRNYFGDVLAVVWLYFVFATVVAARPVVLALAAFGVGCGLELMQYLVSLQHWQIPNRALRIVLGSTPDWMDVLAYGLGALAVLGIEALRAQVGGRTTSEAVTEGAIE